MREAINKTLNARDSRTKFLGVFSYRGNTRLRMVVLLLGADIFSFLLSGFFAIGMRIFIFNEPLRFDLFLQTLPIMAVSLFFYGLTGLYPAVGMSAVEEFKKLVSTTTFVVLALTAVSFWVRNANSFSRLTLTLTWLFSIVVLPVNRDLLRTIAVRLKVWGEPVAIIGFEKQGEWALEFFQKNAKLGLNPVVILDPSGRESYSHRQVRVSKINALYPKEGVGNLTDVKTALIMISDVPEKFMSMISSNQKGGWERLILLPNLEQISSFGVVSFDFGGVLGLEVRHNLLDMRQRAIKRIMDILLSIALGIFFLPIGLMIALCIRLDSPGPVLYSQERLGKDARKIIIYKFRSMKLNADNVLAEYLSKNPSAKTEWEQNQKLHNDPRITRVGKWIRRLSLDEIPQLFNILKGDMSLVGPRPIMLEQETMYGDHIEVYTNVRPGLSGFWQISGRNQTSFRQRVDFDAYYVRNWSIWLDVYIIARTIMVVLLRQGAY